MTAHLETTPVRRRGQHGVPWSASTSVLLELAYDGGPMTREQIYQETQARYGDAAPCDRTCVYALCRLCADGFVDSRRVPPEMWRRENDPRHIYEITDFGLARVEESIGWIRNVAGDWE